MVKEAILYVNQILDIGSSSSDLQETEESSGSAPDLDLNIFPTSFTPESKNLF